MKRKFKIIIIFLASCIAMLVVCTPFMVVMPDKSYEGPLPTLSVDDLKLKTSLKKHVTVLSQDIGPRHFGLINNLKAAQQYIINEFKKIGLEVKLQPVTFENITGFNIVAEIKGSSYPDEIIVVGAHYDSESLNNSPAANHNGTGVAALIELSSLLSQKHHSRTIRFVAFVNEEPPFYKLKQTSNIKKSYQITKEIVLFYPTHMGSYVYAKKAKENNDNILAMFNLETLGFYSNEESSQDYPFPLSMFYPSKGNFIAFVGNLGSRELTRQSIKSFRKNTLFPSSGGVFPGFVPGVSLGDQSSFWAHGYQAVLVTDTTNYRYPHYHLPSDTLDKIDFDRLSIVTKGLETVISNAATQH